MKNKIVTVLFLIGGTVVVFSSIAILKKINIQKSYKIYNYDKKNT
jgi:hypothetical protein